jgi:hypothetical protein
VAVAAAASSERSPTGCRDDDPAMVDDVDDDDDELDADDGEVGRTACVNVKLPLFIEAAAAADEAAE